VHLFIPRFIDAIESFGYIFESFGYIFESFGYIFESFGYIFESFGIPALLIDFYVKKLKFCHFLLQCLLFWYFCYTESNRNLATKQQKMLREREPSLT